MKSKNVLKPENASIDQGMAPKVELLRYIVFLIDSKFKEHDGRVFSDYMMAREFAIDCISDKYADKYVIGMFCLNAHSQEMLITKVESIGFVGDKKHVNQLSLFK